MNTFSCSLVYTWMTISEGNLYVIDSLFWEVSLTRSFVVILFREWITKVLIRDCVDVQTGQHLCCLHVTKSSFPRVNSHMISKSNKPCHHHLLLLGDVHQVNRPNTAYYWSDLAVSWHKFHSAIPRPRVVRAQNNLGLSSPLYCWRPQRWCSDQKCCWNIERKKNLINFVIFVEYFLLTNFQLFKINILAIFNSIGSDN